MNLDWNTRMAGENIDQHWVIKTTKMEILVQIIPGIMTGLEKASP